MITFHGDDKIKEKYSDRVREHIRLDNLVRGMGWENGKGCAVGCTLEKYEHSQYPIELGLPTWIAWLEDQLFEGMSVKKSKTWPGIFLEAIPIGISEDLLHYDVKLPFLEYILEDSLNTFDHSKFKDVKAVIEGVIYLLKNKIATGDIQWSSAINAASAAFNSNAAATAAAHATAAAYAAASAAFNSNAADSVFQDAARVAAYSAVAAAHATARMAAYSAVAAARMAAVAAARVEKYDLFSDKLIKLLKGLKE